MLAEVTATVSLWTVLVPLVSVLVGAVIGGGASLLVERTRARNSRKADLLSVRREVQLTALDEVHRCIGTFREIFVHNHGADDPEADENQANAMQRHFEQLESLSLQANRVDVLASHDVAALVRAVPEKIRDYFMSLDPNGGKFLAAEISRVSGDLDRIFDNLKIKIREDLHTAELDSTK